METNHPNEFSHVMIEKVKKTHRAAEQSNVIVKRAKFDLLDACVRLVTIHGRPFSLLDDEAFRDIINMIPGQSQQLNAHKVRDVIAEKAISVINEIKAEIKGRVVSLKIDAATCMSRSFLGINMQFIKNNKIQIRTLGVVELFQTHTAEYLKETIVYVCAKFEISMNQIFTVTVDNAANMLKTMRILNENENDINDDEIQDNIDDNIIGSEIADVLLTNNEIINLNSEEENNNESLSPSVFTTRTLRCAAHTLQLAMNDLLKGRKVAEIVDRARQVVKKLRTPLIKSALLALYDKNAILDCTTRWHSSVDMLERLVQLKDYCNQLDDKDLKLPSALWTKIDTLLSVLKPAKLATKRLQSEQLILGDVYEIWQRCLIQIQRVDTEFTNELVHNMKKRQDMLFENEIFLAAIYLDPRFNVILTDEQIRSAKNCLVNTYARIEVINTQQEGTRIDDNEVVEETSAGRDEDEFERILRNAETTRTLNRSRSMTSRYSIESEIDDFIKQPRVKPSTDILAFWNNKNCKQCELRKLANVILAVAPTQVSVERLFSGLKFILSPHRSKLNSDVIDNILIIRLNYNKIVEDDKQ